jgi:hypothetical protein
MECTLETKVRKRPRFLSFSKGRTESLSVTRRSGFSRSCKHAAPKFSVSAIAICNSDRTGRCQP